MRAELQKEKGSMNWTYNWDFYDKCIKSEHRFVGKVMSQQDYDQFITRLRKVRGLSETRPKNHEDQINERVLANLRLTKEKNPLND